MSELEKPDLEERVTRLEGLVETLLAGARPERFRPTPPPTLGPRSAPAPAAPLRPAQPPAKESSSEAKPDFAAARVFPGLGGTRSSFFAGQSERWLSRVGIGFVVLAMAFLMKLAFDRGWITPALRLVVGLGVGGVLLAVGLRLEPARKRLAQAFLGGSVAIFYLVGFAGFQWYALIPLWVALSLMTTTTVLSIVLSERQASPALAVIGISGGLATPFLLQTGWENPSATAVYVSVVLLGGGAVQLYRGWTSLLAILLVGGTMVLSAVVFGADGASVVAVGQAVAVFWLVCAASPVLRPLVTSLPPGDRPPELALWDVRAALSWGTVATVVLLSAHLSLEQNEIGMLLLLFGLMTGVAAYLTRSLSLTQRPFAEVSALCVAAGLAFVVDGSSAIVLIAAESLALFALVARGAPSSLRTVGHALAAVVAVAFLYYAADAPIDGLLGLREGAYARLGVMGMFLVCSIFVEEENTSVYKRAAYVGLLVWFLSELGPKEYGAQLVSTAWSVQGATALVASRRTRSYALQIAGLATLGLVAAKLLLIDLSQLDPVWRILMFMSFGAALLALAYLVNRPRKGQKPDLNVRDMNVPDVSVRDVPT